MKLVTALSVIPPFSVDPWIGPSSLNPLTGSILRWWVALAYSMVWVIVFFALLGSRSLGSAVGLDASLLHKIEGE